ncbi:YmfQ family protein [Paraburkholderia sp. BR14263]|uniref:YmfQ family protein n=1 Tax=unclassified Paraburkholderia TaxID=2615204 RepID=UPI0034CEAC7C
MAAPNYQASDFAGVIHALLPRGLVWPRDPHTVMAQAIAGLAPTWARHAQSNGDLLVDAFPATAVDLLTEWEETLGLPDPCAGESPTLQQRQAQVVARLTNTGGQSVPFFIGYAQTLGYAVTITEFTPFRVGQQTVGDPVGSVAWAFAWQVNAPPVTVEYFRASRSAVGEPLASWNNAVLACEMNSLKPAHTTVIIANTGFLDTTFRLDSSTLS